MLTGSDRFFDSSAGGVAERRASISQYGRLLLLVSRQLVSITESCADWPRSLRIIRGNDYIFRSEEQQHSFNYPVQVGTNSKDTPLKDAQRFNIKVQKDDVSLRLGLPAPCTRARCALTTRNQLLVARTRFPFLKTADPPRSLCRSSSSLPTAYSTISLTTIS